ncbi:complement C1q-like protein 4 [Mytilus trossulus]|uniref:complement C1q-like protein 4 n=1 Tax=Mytilus trossulus TaxID=6551 RepID=UPI0030063C50
MATTELQDHDLGEVSKESSFICNKSILLDRVPGCPNIEMVTCRNVGQSDVKKRLLLQPDNTASDALVAFYAYMSIPENNPSAHHTLIYDVSVTNVGSGYNHVTGIFTAPTSGIYVFIWVTRVYNGEHPTELMINTAVYGVTFLRAKGSSNDGSVSGTVVANVTKGDAVFVRVHSSYPGDGYIYSNVHGRPSFSGWLLR